MYHHHCNCTMYPILLPLEDPHLTLPLHFLSISINILAGKPAPSASVKAPPNSNTALGFMDFMVFSSSAFKDYLIMDVDSTSPTLIIYCFHKFHLSILPMSTGIYRVFQKEVSTLVFVISRLPCALK